MTTFDRGWVILRETQKIKPSQREFRSRTKTWTTELSEALILFDEVQIWEVIRRFSTLAAHRFHTDKGYAVYTSFKRAEVQIIEGQVVLIEPHRTLVPHASPRHRRDHRVKSHQISS